MLVPLLVEIPFDVGKLIFCLMTIPSAPRTWVTAEPALALKVDSLVWAVQVTAVTMLRAAHVKPGASEVLNELTPI